MSLTESLISISVKNEITPLDIEDSDSKISEMEFRKKSSGSDAVIWFTVVCMTTLLLAPFIYHLSTSDFSRIPNKCNTGCLECYPGSPNFCGKCGNGYYLQPNMRCDVECPERYTKNDTDHICDK